MFLTKRYLKLSKNCIMGHSSVLIVCRSVGLPYNTIDYMTIFVGNINSGLLFGETLFDVLHAYKLRENA